MSVTREDYRSTFFPFKNLTRIVGEPTLVSLLTLRDQIKANAASVHTTLGGGIHGHLGLVVTPTVYVTIQNTVLYVRPVLPQLNITPTDTRYQLEEKRHQYQKDMELFREVNAVESTIIQQIVSAITQTFLEPFINKTTGGINNSIPDILEYLFKVYGDVSPNELARMKQKVEEMTYEPSEPIDTVFTAIDRLADVAEMCLRPYSPEQKADMVYIILQNTRKFSSGLGKWDAKQQRIIETAGTAGNPIPPVDFKALKDHFRDVHKALRKRGDLTLEDTFNKNDVASLVTEGIKEGIELALHTAHREVAEETTNEQEDIQKALMAKITELDETVKRLKSEKAVAKTIPQWQPSSQPFWHPMMGMPPNMSMNGFPSMDKNTFQQGHNNSNNDDSNKKRYNKLNSKYCWSCGATNHWGKKCRTKKPGHMDKASFRNKLNGSTKNCWST